MCFSKLGCAGLQFVSEWSCSDLPPPPPPPHPPRRLRATCSDDGNELNPAVGITWPGYCCNVVTVTALLVLTCILRVQIISGQGSWMCLPWSLEIGSHFPTANKHVRTFCSRRPNYVIQKIQKNRMSLCPRPPTDVFWVLGSQAVLRTHLGAFRPEPWSNLSEQILITGLNGVNESVQAGANYYKDIWSCVSKIRTLEQCFQKDKSIRK